MASKTIDRQIDDAQQKVTKPLGSFGFSSGSAPTEQRLTEPVGQFSKYLGDDLSGSPETRLNRRADAQGNLEKLSRQVGHGLSSFGTSFASSFAAIPIAAGYAVAAPMSEEVDFLDFIENPMLKGLSDIHASILESTPVYSRANQSDSYGDYLGSAAFWDEMSQGVGFLASLLLSGRMASAATSKFGYALKGLATGRKAGKGYNLISKLTRPTRTPFKDPFVAIDDAAKLGKLENILKRVNPISSALFARVGESVIETNGAIDEMSQLLAPKLESGEITLEEYNQRLEDIRQSVFSGNMALGLVDAMQFNALFGSRALTKLMGKEAEMMKRMGVKSKDVLTKEGQKIVKPFKLNKREAFNIAADVIGKGGITEAGEELWQNLLVQRFKKSPDLTGYGDFVGGTLAELDYTSTWTDIENQKAMTMGAALGMGMGAFAYAPIKGMGKIQRRMASARKYADLYNFYNAEMKNLAQMPDAKNVDMIRNIQERLATESMRPKQREQLVKRLESLMQKTYTSDGKWDLVDHNELQKIDAQMEAVSAKLTELAEQESTAKTADEKNKLQTDIKMHEKAMDFLQGLRNLTQKDLERIGKDKQLRLNPKYKNNLNQISSIHMQMQTIKMDTTLTQDEKKRRLEPFELQAMTHQLYGAFLAGETHGFLSNLEGTLEKAELAKQEDDQEAIDGMLELTGMDSIDSAIEVIKRQLETSQTALKAIEALDSWPTFNQLDPENRATAIRLLTHQKAIANQLADANSQVEALETQVHNTLGMSKVPVNFQLNEDGNLTDNEGFEIPEQTIEAIPQLTELKTVLKKRNQIKKELSEVKKAETELSNLEEKSEELAEKIDSFKKEKKIKSDFYDNKSSEELRQLADSQQEILENLKQKKEELRESKTEENKEEVNKEISDINKRISEQQYEDKISFIESLADKKEIEEKIENLNEIVNRYNELESQRDEIQKEIASQRKEIEEKALYAGLDSDQIAELKNKKDLARRLNNTNESLIATYESFKWAEERKDPGQIDPDVVEEPVSEFEQNFTTVQSQWERAAVVRKIFAQLQTEYGSTLEEIKASLEELNEEMRKALSNAGFEQSTIQDFFARIPITVQIGDSFIDLKNLEPDAIFNKLISKLGKKKTPVPFRLLSPAELLNHHVEKAFADLTNEQLNLLGTNINLAVKSKDTLMQTRSEVKKEIRTLKKALKRAKKKDSDPIEVIAPIMEELVKKENRLKKINNNLEKGNKKIAGMRRMFKSIAEQNSPVSFEPRSSRASIAASTAVQKLLDKFKDLPEGSFDKDLAKLEQELFEIKQTYDSEIARISSIIDKGLLSSAEADALIKELNGYEELQVVINPLLDEVRLARKKQEYSGMFNYLEAKLIETYLIRKNAKKRKGEQAVLYTMDRHVPTFDAKLVDTDSHREVAPLFSLTMPDTSMSETDMLSEASLQWYLDKNVSEADAIAIQKEYWANFQNLKDYMNNAKVPKKKLHIRIKFSSIKNTEGETVATVKRAYLVTKNSDGSFSNIEHRGKSMFLLVAEGSKLEDVEYNDWFTDIEQGDIYKVKATFLSPKLNLPTQEDPQSFDLERSNIHIRVSDNGTYEYDPQPLTEENPDDYDLSVMDDTEKYPGMVKISPKLGNGKVGFASTVSIREQDAQVVAELLSLAMEGDEYNTAAVTLGGEVYKPIDLVKQYVTYGILKNEAEERTSDYALFVSNDRVFLQIPSRTGELIDFNFSAADLANPEGRQIFVDVLTKNFRYNVRNNLLGKDYLDIRLKDGKLALEGTRPYKTRLFKDGILLSYAKLNQSWDNPVVEFDTDKIDPADSSAPKTDQRIKNKRASAQTKSTKTKVKSKKSSSAKKSAGRSMMTKAEEDQLDSMRDELGLDEFTKPVSNLGKSVGEFMNQDLTKEERAEFRKLREQGIITTKC